jgi:hypothetical protein
VPERQRRGQIVNNADVFALDLHRALVEQLPEALDALEPAPLSRPNLDVLGTERGVYQLLERGRSVYIGKSEQPLALRLDQHRRRCTGRLNIDVNEMSFRCLYVDRFVDAAAPERVLIERYQARGEAPWNVQEGFAPKDVGRQRDRGRPGQWFLDRPADHEALITVPEGGRRIPLLAALERLKTAVPFDLFRYASSRSQDRKDRADAEQDYPGRYIVLPDEPAPTLLHLRAVIERLPEGWQATVLPHGVILYKEQYPYDYALAGWHHTLTGVAPLPCGSEIADSLESATRPDVMFAADSAETVQAPRNQS